VPPLFTLNIADGQYLITFAVLTAVGVLIGTLMNSVRLQARVAGHRERRTALLYAMSRELAGVRGVDAMARVAVRHIGEAFEAQVALLLPDESGALQLPRAKPEPSSLRGADLSIAQWVQDHGQQAGLGTDTLPGTESRYLPLPATAARRHQLGVLAILPANPRHILLPEQSHLLDTFASQLALALERAQLADQAQAARIEVETESVRNSLLAAISHDMRTPLAVISGAASSLADDESKLDSASRHELAQSIVEQATQMTQLVANVLDMTRLESGRGVAKPEWMSLEEAVGSALHRLRGPLAAHEVAVQLDDAPPLIYADPILLEQLLFNLLENAAKYTPAGTHVRISARRAAHEIELLVADDGPGFVPDVEPETLFDKFQRGRAEGAIGGVGLGLAICRAIARVHDGEIRAERIPAGGALFVVSLPQTKEAPLVPREEMTE